MNTENSHLTDVAKNLDQIIGRAIPNDTYFVMPVTYPEYICVYVEDDDTYETLVDQVPDTFHTYDVKVRKVE